MPNPRHILRSLPVLATLPIAFSCTNPAAKLPACPVQVQPIGTLIADDPAGVARCQPPALQTASREDHAHGTFAINLPRSHQRYRSSICEYNYNFNWCLGGCGLATFSPRAHEMAPVVHQDAAAMVQAAEAIRLGPKTVATKDAALVQLVGEHSVAQPCLEVYGDLGVPYMLILWPTGEVYVWGPAEITARIRARESAGSPNATAPRIDVGAVLRHFREHAVPQGHTQLIAFVHDDVLAWDYWHLAWALDRAVSGPASGLNVPSSAEEIDVPTSASISLRVADFGKLRLAPKILTDQLQALGMPWPFPQD